MHILPPSLAYFYQARTSNRSEGSRVARSGAAVNEAMNEAAVSFIEDGLRQRKTVKEILEAMRREPAFSGVGRARLMRHWTETWRPMVAKAGRVPLPKRGGDRRTAQAAAPTRPMRPPQPAPVAVVPAPSSHRASLEEMLDLVTAMLTEGPDSPTREAALRAFPGFVRAVREVVKQM